jgi:hypothetical protein
LLAITVHEGRDGRTAGATYSDNLGDTKLVGDAAIFVEAQRYGYSIENGYWSKLIVFKVSTQVVYLRKY